MKRTSCCSRCRCACGSYSPITRWTSTSGSSSSGAGWCWTGRTSPRTLRRSGSPSSHGTTWWSWSSRCRTSSASPNRLKKTRGNGRTGTETRSRRTRAVPRYPGSGNRSATSFSACYSYGAYAWTGWRRRRRPTWQIRLAGNMWNLRCWTSKSATVIPPRARRSSSCCRPVSIPPRTSRNSRLRRLAPTSCTRWRSGKGRRRWRPSSSKRRAWRATGCSSRTAT